MQNIVKHLSLYILLFASFTLNAQSNEGKPFKMTTPDTYGTATLTLNIPLTHSVKQPYVTLENLTKGTYMRYTTFPGESTCRTVPVALEMGDQYRLTAHILPNPGDPNDDTDEDVLATLRW